MSQRTFKIIWAAMAIGAIAYIFFLTMWTQPARDAQLAAAETAWSATRTQATIQPVATATPMPRTDKEKTPILFSALDLGLDLLCLVFWLLVFFGVITVSWGRSR